jgi:hypothetical protein
LAGVYAKPEMAGGTNAVGLFLFVKDFARKGGRH